MSSFANLNSSQANRQSNNNKGTSSNNRINQHQLLTNKEKQILASHREIQWLRRRIAELQQEAHTATDAQQLSIPTEASRTHVEDGIVAYERLLDEQHQLLQNIHQVNQTQERLLSLVDKQYFTMEALYPNYTITTNTTETAHGTQSKAYDHAAQEVKLKTEDKINKRDGLVIQFMRVLDDLNKHKKRLTEVQAQIIEQHKRNREVMQRLDELREQKNRFEASEWENPEVTALMKAIQDKKDQISVLRGILTGIILESGIHWEEDERWLVAILRSGQPLPLTNI